jgi:hypothetical protein
MDNLNQIYPFNNSIETGLRSLCILTACFPAKFDLDYLVCLDFICVHSGDFDSEMPSLHAATPNRAGEVYVRRAMIENGIHLLIHNNLIIRLYTDSGIEYQASETASPFVENLLSRYSQNLFKRADWLRRKMIMKNKHELEEMIKKQSSDFLFQTLS